MDRIRFRQLNERGGWHYWGFIDGNFVGPLSTFGLKGGESYQFTGLQDIKGKDVYDGDIVLAHAYRYKKVFPRNRKRWLVQWNPHYMSGWELRDKSDDNTAIDSTLENDPEVIGNIVQNPELLKR
jgi:hypothetical protein